MAARRSSESASPPRSKPSHGRSRRSPSSSLSRSPKRLPSLSPSPRSKRLRRAKEASAWVGGDKDLDRGKQRDYDRRDYSKGRERHHDRGREKNHDVSRERDFDRGGHKGRDRERIKNGEKGSERDRDKDGREKSRGRRGERDSPMWSRQSRSLSPRTDNQRRSHASPKRKSVPSPSHRRSPDHDQDKFKARNAARNASAAISDEEMSGKGEIRVDGEDDSLAKMMAAEAALEAKQKEKDKPSFEYSGKLAAETNRVRGVTLLFTEPPEARKPTIRWRLYVFKEGEPLNEPLYIHRQSCYLFGRERRVADIPTDHISCSKQHAIIQYRLTEKEEADGNSSSKVRPYLMDLGSTNGTVLNGERLEPHRYYEMYEKDTIKFGNSSREYVLLHENSAS